tara:strand:+ start:83 stop:919 length:837 start_codon:yes stop_codon:yes gene_type:complete
LKNETRIDDINTIPDCHGVYFFNNDKKQPIYIGKSISLISRIKSHIYQAKNIYKEKKIITESRSITWKKYSNELESLIMESYYVKLYLPKFNRKLRRQKKIYSILFNKENKFIYKIIENKTKDFNFIQDSYGIFKSKNIAIKKIDDICDEFMVCKKTIGLEKGSGPCFGYQIKKCLGACIGIENIERNNKRFLEQIKFLKNICWPYKGAIGLTENKITKKHQNIICIENWIFIGIVKTKKNYYSKNFIFENKNLEFDIDQYKTIIKYISEKKVNIIEF